MRDSWPGAGDWDTPTDPTEPPRPCEELDRIADAVHQAAHWLVPWSPPEELVTSAGYQMVYDARPATHPRRVVVPPIADEQARGVAVLLAFAAVLRREILGEGPDAMRDRMLAGRLLIPAAMVATAKRDSSGPSQHAPRAFIDERLREAGVAHSGTFPSGSGR